MPHSISDAFGEPQHLRIVLRKAYGYHRATEAMTVRLLADGRDHEIIATYDAHR